MDIDKLQKLGCLSLNEDSKSAMQESIDSVMNMMRCIDQIAVEDHLPTDLIETTLALDEVHLTDAISKESPTSGVHMQDGVFLAPKTIRK